MSAVTFAVIESLRIDLKASASTSLNVVEVFFDDMQSNNKAPKCS